MVLGGALQVKRDEAHHPSRDHAGWLCLTSPSYSTLNQTPTSAACSYLETTMKTGVVLPSDDRYQFGSEDSLVQTAWASLVCIIQAEQVSRSVKYLAQRGVHFTICSGANSPAPPSVEYHAERNFAVVGTGTRWVVGGRILHVGISGLTLGSELSYRSDPYGLACDNHALKGGVDNSGVVTRFTLATYPTWDAMLQYQSVGAKDTKDAYANLMMQAFPSNGTLGVLLNLVYTKPVEMPAAFAPFYSISTIADTIHTQPMTDFLASQISPSLPRLNWCATSFETDATLFEIVEKDRSIAVGWQPNSTSAIAAGHARKEDALGLEYVNQMWLAMDVSWSDTKNDAVANKATMRLIAKYGKYCQEQKKACWLHLHERCRVTQDVIAHYGNNSVAKLCAVQRRYDPRAIFQELVPGGFKLPPVGPKGW
ncbi:putative FAD-binding oxidoreductase [Nemania sp. FL0916]|nr:putative FAD-binding oxidoreductase [Nemania sp. FL0916]